MAAQQQRNAEWSLRGECGVVPPVRQRMLPVLLHRLDTFCDASEKQLRYPDNVPTPLLVVRRKGRRYTFLAMVEGCGEVFREDVEPAEQP